MAGINTIVEFYKKHGEDKLKTLLTSDLRITEKYDAHRFSFEKTEKGFVFFGKNGSSALSHVDRTINNLYESAIQHIENLPREIKSQIPRGQRFGFSFFPNNKPLKIEYQKVPKNHLVLTDLTIRKGDKISESIVNHEVLKRWSTVLNTECDKPLFEGRLDEHTLDALLESIKQEDNITQLFENDNTNMFLRTNDLTMEGIVFQCSTDRGNLLLKYEDSQYITESVSKGRDHMFDILLMNIFGFVESYKLPRIIDESRTDDRYISIICEMFNSYVKKYGDDFLSMNLKKPAFLEKSGSFVHEWIKDKKTITILKENKNYEYLLSIFLTNLKKEKKTGGLLTESLVNNFNKIVVEIDELSRGTSDDYAHLEFSPLTETETYFLSSVKDIKEDIIETPEVNDAENIRAISLMQKVFSKEPSTTKLGKEEVNVLLGNYTLFTDKDFSAAESLHKKNGKRVIIVHVSQDKKSGDKFAFENIKVKKMLSKLVEENEDVFTSCDIINAPLISQVYQGLRPKYEPILIAVNGSTGSLEIEYASRKWLSTQYSDNLSFLSYSSGIDAVYKTLETGSVADFSKLVPDIISKYFMEYQSEYRKFIYVS